MIICVFVTMSNLLYLHKSMSSIVNMKMIRAALMNIFGLFQSVSRGSGWFDSFSFRKIDAFYHLLLPTHEPTFLILFFLLTDLFLSSGLPRSLAAGLGLQVREAASHFLLG